MRIPTHSCGSFVSSKISRTKDASSDMYSRVLDFLDGGIASSSRLDGLGKGIGEYLRSRVVDVPEMFLSRGWI